VLPACGFDFGCFGFRGSRLPFMFFFDTSISMAREPDQRCAVRVAIVHPNCGKSLPSIMARRRKAIPGVAT
jgi:hypothetical protein